MTRFTSLALVAVFFATPAHALLRASASKDETQERELTSSQVCNGHIGPFDDMTRQMFYNAKGMGVLDALDVLEEDQLKIGSVTALIPEANDASVSGSVADGQSGDTDFPHGNIKPIATVGEMSVCNGSEGEMVVGVPDGLGAYLSSDDLVRVVVQSESYGPLRYESYPFPVNEGTATFTGSHVQYVDYDRDALASFMDSGSPASDMVKGFGEIITKAYNLKGEEIGPRNRDGPTTEGAHYSNTDAEGNYVVVEEPSRADWLLQSLCAAHLEEKHQWGHGKGFEDDVFITNEEWMTYADDAEKFVGLSAHAVDLKEGVMYAMGSVTNSGFEKIVEMNPQNEDYVILSPSGYGGAFSTDGKDATVARREALGARQDGNPWVWPQNILPGRIYIGVKGKMEDGSNAPHDDFLARNGLRYGQMYGFAIDMSENGPTGGMDRDPFHQDETKAKNGAHVQGKWMKIDWMWDGTVQNFEHDGTWLFQDKPVGATGNYADYAFWNGKGNDASGKKMEHNSPDPRNGKTGFIQGSTAGYFGHYYVQDIAHHLGKANGGFPDMLDGDYYVYQGAIAINDQIELGGKGKYADGKDASHNYSNGKTERARFEDIDGLEVIHAAGDNLHVIIQEDSGNNYGERMFLSSALEHNMDNKELTYYFMAMSGGSDNTRMKNAVGIPRGTSYGAGSHEFSGIFDLSGLLRKDGHMNKYAVSVNDTGFSKRHSDSMVAAEDKYILLGLQSGNMRYGVIGAFGSDRGGQWLVYQPCLSSSCNGSQPPMLLLSDKETITSGEKITFPNGKYIYQHPSGPVEIGYGDKVLWMSDPEHNNVHSASTKLQGDANLLTRNQDGKRIWKSDATSTPDDDYFLGITTDHKIKIWEGTPENPGAIIWEAN